MLATQKIFQNHQTNEKHQAQIAFQNSINRQAGPMHRKQKMLIRDQNLKDVILVIQRRIPR